MTLLFFGSTLLWLYYPLIPLFFDSIVLWLCYSLTLLSFDSIFLWLYCSSTLFFFYTTFLLLYFSLTPLFFDSTILLLYYYSLTTFLWPYFSSTLLFFDSTISFVYRKFLKYTSFDNITDIHLPVTTLPILEAFHRCMRLWRHGAPWPAAARTLVHRHCVWQILRHLFLASCREAFQRCWKGGVGNLHWNLQYVVDKRFFLTGPFRVSGMFPCHRAIVCHERIGANTGKKIQALLLEICFTTRQGSSFGALDARYFTRVWYDMSEMGQVSNTKPVEPVGKGKIANIVSGYAIQKPWHRLTLPFQVYTLYCVHHFCNFMLETKPASCFAVVCFLHFFSISGSSFHVRSFDGLQSLCSVRIPRALLRCTHHYHRRRGRELTQRIPWCRMVEQVASQAPCRPSKNSHGVLLNEEKHQVWNVQNHCC